VADYDRRRASVAEVKQLSLFVVDEASAIQWLRRELTTKLGMNYDTDELVEVIRCAAR